MKKVVLSVLACLVLLCGCGKSKETAVKLESISFDADITLAAYTCTCSIELSGGGLMSSTLLSPESVEGTTLKYDGEKLTINYMGLEYTPEMPIENETANGIINTIFQSAASGGKTAERVGDSLVLEGEVAGYSYSLYVTDEGLPLRLVCEKANLTAEFSNVKIK